MTKEAWDKLIKDFISVRSFITLGAFATVYVMTWNGKIAPDIIVRIVDLLLGYWFGEKVAKAVTQANEGGAK
jgi:hypothetical protein